MKLDTALKIFKEKESKSLREGYRGDAAHYAFQQYVLIFLSEIAQKTHKKKRKLSAWQLFMTGYLRSGKSLNDASRDWKKRVRS